MNIVKLKDVIMPECFGMADFFNSKLKGKYAYWIQMRYIFSLDSLCYSEYIKYEQYDAIDFLSVNTKPYIDLYSEEYCMIDFAKEYIDLCDTEEANDIHDYIISNMHSTDMDIDINMIKQFRTWLATELLKLDAGLSNESNGLFSSEQKYMLEFYKNGMYNEVLKHLEYFGNPNKVSNAATTTSCGCSAKSTNFIELNTNICDVKTIYINNIHDLMVKTFEQPYFWINLNKKFVKVVKKYIDNIIAVGLSINTTTPNINPYIDCECTYNTLTKNNFETILNNLSVSLEYIINENHNGHLNFIHDSLYNWAEHLYDKMYW